MPSLKAIKKRITSVKSTQKITRAMKLVSAAKLKRAQDRAQQSRPFEQLLLDMVATILSDAKWSSPLTEQREVKKVCLVVYTTDRGLCGALNSNMIKQVSRRIQELGDKSVELICLGKKAYDFFRKRGFTVRSHLSGLVRTGSHEKMAEISQELRKLYEEKVFDQIEIIYPRFVSAVAQKPTVVSLLPFKPEAGKTSEMCIYEPRPDQLMNRLVPMLIDFQMYRFLLEAIASEHAARMAAMEAATKNSKEMIARLTLERNRARQAVITKELMEIIGGAEAIAA